MPLYLFYTMVQKSQKMTKNPNQGGGGHAEERELGQEQSLVEYRTWGSWVLKNIHLPEHAAVYPSKTISTIVKLCWKTQIR